MKNASTQQVQEFIEAHYNHLTYNKRTFAVEFPDGTELKDSDYIPIANEATRALNLRVSGSLTKILLNSGMLSDSPVRISPFWTHSDQYQILNGKPVALLHRQEEADRSDACPFCGKTHKHGKETGHRSPHCITIQGSKKTLNGRFDIIIRKQILATDGTLLNFEDGYILKIY